MAIGSDPEIGVQFTTWGKMSPTARAAWYNYMRTEWGPDLQQGYGTLVYVDEAKRKEYYDAILLSLPDM